jgi:hypothetical protein
MLIMVEITNSNIQISVRIYLYFPPPFHLILDGRTVENKGKLILTEIFPSVQKHDI